MWSLGGVSVKLLLPHRQGPLQGQGPCMNKNKVKMKKMGGLVMVFCNIKSSLNSKNLYFYAIFVDSLFRVILQLSPKGIIKVFQ